MAQQHRALGIALQWEKPQSVFSGSSKVDGRARVCASRGLGRGRLQVCVCPVRVCARLSLDGGSALRPGDKHVPVEFC